MAGPITWRNIGATVTPGSVSSRSDASADPLAGMFDSLRRISDDYQGANNANFENTQSTLQNQLLDRLHQARTLEEVEALHQDQGLQQLRDQLVGDYRSAVRGSLDTREKQIIDQTTARQGFQDKQHNRGLQPQLQQELLGAYQGDRGALERLVQLGYRDDGELLATGFDAFTDSQEEQRASNKDRRDGARLSLEQNRDARAGELHGFKVDALEHEATQREAQDWAVGVIDGLADQVIQGDIADPTALRDARRQLRDTLADNPNVTGSQADSLLAQFDTQVVSNATVSPIMDAFTQQQVAQEEQALGLTNNPHYQGLKASDLSGQSGSVVTRDVFNNWMNDDKRIFNELDTEVREKIVQEGYQLVTGGAVGKVRDGSGNIEEVTVPFDGALLEMMAMSVEGYGGWNPFKWDRKSTLKENAEGFLEANPELVRAQQALNHMRGVERDLQEGARQQAHPLAGLLQYLRPPE